MITHVGLIIKGSYINWKISIDDDTCGDTGGYYLFLKKDENEGYDYWFEKFESLENQLKNFSVKWQQINNS